MEKELYLFCISTRKSDKSYSNWNTPLENGIIDVDSDGTNFTIWWGGIDNNKYSLTLPQKLFMIAKLK